jgi:hypothetical protein
MIRHRTHPLVQPPSVVVLVLLVYSHLWLAMVLSILVNNQPHFPPFPAEFPDFSMTAPHGGHVLNNLHP